MDMRTGEIAPLKEFKQRKVPRKYLREVVENEAYIRLNNGQVVHPIKMSSLPQRVQSAIKKTGRAWISRNSTCPCGSGKRFKRCCMMEKE